MLWNYPDTSSSSQAFQTGDEGKDDHLLCLIYNPEKLWGDQWKSEVKAKMMKKIQVNNFNTEGEIRTSSGNNEKWLKRPISPLQLGEFPGGMV
jgi:hypothetical protein